MQKCQVCEATNSLIGHKHLGKHVGTLVTSKHKQQLPLTYFASYLPLVYQTIILGELSKGNTIDQTGTKTGTKSTNSNFTRIVPNSPAGKSYKS